MQFDWAMQTSLIQKRLSYLSIKALCFYGLFVVKIITVALVLELIWYYSTSCISNIGDLVRYI